MKLEGGSDWHSEDIPSVEVGNDTEYSLSNRSIEQCGLVFFRIKKECEMDIQNNTEDIE